MRLKDFDYRQPQSERRPLWNSTPTAAVAHRKRGRVVLTHAAAETCDLCQKVAAQAAAAPQVIHVDNSMRDSWINTEPIREGSSSEERDPFTVWSRRAYHSKSLDEVISMPQKVFEDRNRKR